MKSTISRRFAIIAGALATFGTLEAAAQSGSTPCGLLTAAQVSSAVGATVGNGEPIATTGCTWSWGRATATLSLSDASKWDQMKAPLPGMTRSSVSGLLDDGHREAISGIERKEGCHGLPIQSLWCRQPLRSAVHREDTCRGCADHTFRPLVPVRAITARCD